MVDVRFMGDSSAFIRRTRQKVHSLLLLTDSLLAGLYGKTV